MVAEGSGERRLSLYDVLTGEAPLPPTRGGMPDTAGAEAASTTGREVGRGLRSGGGGGSGSGIGVVPLDGGARRASIFDRIADVVFNEEQKEQDPVDAIAVRLGGWCRPCRFIVLEVILNHPTHALPMAAVGVGTAREKGVESVQAQTLKNIGLSASVRELVVMKTWFLRRFFRTRRPPLSTRSSYNPFALAFSGLPKRQLGRRQTKRQGMENVDHRIG